MPTLLARKPITVIRPLEHLNAATSGEFGRQLMTAISAPGVVAVVVDFAEVTFMDSAGLMALVSGSSRRKKWGGGLVFARYPPGLG